MQRMPRHPTRFFFPIGASREAGRALPNHPFPAPLLAGTRANLRLAAARRQRKTRPQVNSLTWRARAALRHRCDAEEEPMSDLAARLAYSPLLSTAFKVVCLFCVLGLALSVAIVPMIAPEYLAWVLSHIE